MSSKPKWASAAAESPPPTTVTPGRARDGLGDRARAGGERLVLEGAHRAVPEDGARLRDLGGVALGRGGADVEAHPARRAPRRRRALATQCLRRSSAIGGRSEVTRSAWAPAAAAAQSAGGRWRRGAVPSLARASSAAGVLDVLVAAQRLADRVALARTGAKRGSTSRRRSSPTIGDRCAGSGRSRRSCPPPSRRRSTATSGRAGCSRIAGQRAHLAFEQPPGGARQ